MKGVAALVLFAAIGACKNHEDASARPEPTSALTNDASDAASPVSELGGGHLTPRPRLRPGQMTVTGRLPPDVIQRIVHHNYGRFRPCYDDGLIKNQELKGTVTTRFVIDARGLVSSSKTDPSTTLGDATVAACIARGFRELQFPPPESGVVVVVYSIILEPPVWDPRSRGM